MSEKRKDHKGRILRSGESQRKDLTYMFRYGKQRRCIYANTLDELRKKEQEVMRDEADGLDYAAGKTTVYALVKGTLERKGNIRSTSQRSYTTVLNIIEKDELGSREIRKVTTAMAKDWVKKLRRAGRSYNSIKLIKSTLSQAFTEAVEDDIIRRNPFSFSLAQVIPNDTVPRTSLDTATKERFLNCVRNDRICKRYYNDIVILLETGMRVSELYGLTRNDIDFEKRTISITHQLLPPKTKDERYRITPPKTPSGVRVIPMRKNAMECLRAVAQESRNRKVEPVIDGYSGFLFMGRTGYPRKASTLEYAIEKAVERYNKTAQVPLPRIFPHIFRHTFCSERVAEGMDLKSLQYVMGHAKVDMSLSTYAHHDYAVVEKAMLN